MQLDVVNNENRKVGSVDLSDDVFGGRVNTDLMWESVVRANASERQGTHATKNRALVSGSGNLVHLRHGGGGARGPAALELGAIGLHVALVLAHLAPPLLNPHLHGR